MIKVERRGDWIRLLVPGVFGGQVIPMTTTEATDLKGQIDQVLSWDLGADEPMPNEQNGTHRRPHALSRHCGCDDCVDFYARIF